MPQTPGFRHSRAGAAANPVLVEVTRGDMIESVHRGAAAVVHADGSLVEGFGDIERSIYPRSAIKPLQAIPLLESGAADAFGLGDVEIALACASHGGEPAHVESVAVWLARIGLSVRDLECGGHRPSYRPAWEVMVRRDEPFSALHNNCSGKHTGFLTTAVHLGEPTAGYIRAAHPVQGRVRRVIEEMGGVELGDAPTGIDGCGIPVIAMSLRTMALAMARLADPSALSAARRDAARRVVRAMTAQPFMVAGSRRFCSDAIRAGTGAVVAKAGAEGVFAIALPERGLGMALKIDDGAGRAAEVLAARLIAGHIGEPRLERTFSTMASRTVHNVAGHDVGRLRPAQS